MKTKIIFLASTVIVAMILLLTEVITFDLIWENIDRIGLSVGLVYVWLTSEQNKTKVKHAQNENEELKVRLENIQ